MNPETIVKSTQTDHRYYYPEGIGQKYPDGFNPDSIRRTPPIKKPENTTTQSQDTINIARKARASYDAGTFCG
jgi:hypothetical protein